MDIQQARHDILTWMQQFVETANPDLGGWSPCPFARQARLSNAVDIRAGSEPYLDLRMLQDISPWRVVILVYDPREFSAQEFDDLVMQGNQAFLAGRDLIALPDHPCDPEQVGDVVMNQGQWALIMVQRLSELDQHAAQLAQQGYYHEWPQQYLDLLFRGRRDPRA